MRLRPFLVLVLLGIASQSVSADLFINYSETFTGTFIVDGTSYAGSTIILSATGDANQINGPGVDSNPAGVSSIDAAVKVTAILAGGGTLTYTLSGSPSDVGVYVDQSLGSLGAAGFFDNYSGQMNNIMATVSSQFSAASGYTLSTLISVPSSITDYTANQTFATQNGHSIGFGSDVASNTFLAAVPEPSSFAMSAIALFVGGAGFWSRKRLQKSRIA